MTKSNKALVKGDLVLITGGTGWVGSHIVEQAIIHGLRVRLAIRSKEKAERLIKALKEKYGQSIHLETVEVKDFAVEGAYDEAVKDVQGIVHTASNLNFTNDFDEIVGSSLRSYELLLEAAHKQGKAIKRVVITSSSIALGSPSVLPNDPEQHFTTETWNETDLKEAKHQPTSWNVYAASKVLSERYTRNFVKENICEFVLNIINPNACYGAKVVGTEYMSTGTWIRRGCLEANEDIIKAVKSQYHVDVDDVGLLHVLALTREDIVNERILAFGEVFTWDQLFEMTKRLAPQKYNPAAKTEVTAQRDRTTVDLTRTQEILKPYGGLKTLEHSMRLNLQD